MLPRDVKPPDLASIEEIDGTIDSTSYFHVSRECSADAFGWRLERRKLRERVIDSNRLGADLAFTLRQYASGLDEGLALCVDIDETPVAMVLAEPRASIGTLHLLDLRVDFDYRRQGMGTALYYAVLAVARAGEFRAVTAESVANNFPACCFFRKMGFEAVGIDTHRHTNHDWLNERTTILWCAAIGDGR